MTQILVHDGPRPPHVDAERSAERRWAVVFKLSAPVPESSQRQYLDLIPLRAAFADGPALGPILVLRSTGPKMSAFADALAAYQHLASSSDGAIDFEAIEMVPHDGEVDDESPAGPPVALVSIKGAAAKLGVSVTRARQLLKDDKLPPAHAAADGDRPLWLEGEFERFANARRAAVARTPLGCSPSPVAGLRQFVNAWSLDEDHPSDI